MNSSSLWKKHKDEKVVCFISGELLQLLPSGGSETGIGRFPRSKSFSSTAVALREKHLTPHWQSRGFTLLTIYLPRVSHFAVFLFHILLTWQRRIELCLRASQFFQEIEIIYQLSSHLRSIHICSLETSSDEGPRNEYKYGQRSPAIKGIVRLYAIMYQRCHIRKKY